MRWLLLVMVAAVPGAAWADSAKPAGLPAKAAAEGWLLAFDGETTFGWTTQGDVRVKDGTLLLGGEQPASARMTTRFPSCEWQAEVSVDGGPWRTVSGRSLGGATDVAGGKAVLGVLGIDSERGVLAVRAAAGQRVALRNVRVRPLGLKPLFNGKDLAGWKVYDGEPARMKSTFTVTPEGWLHMKNGPGDLQTTSLHDDFVLQLECKTNGDRLNSGVFFRCRPGEYQQGYEAQVHNGYGPPKDYVVEVYDPTTHELKEKAKVASPTLDYGTGAIYRRVPARRATAKDREWFTMTVVADGRHVATWVDGVPVVDWTDNRPAKDNARNGFRAEKGAVSLQGHDPTTDVFFRNIRVAPLNRP